MKKDKISDENNYRYRFIDLFSGIGAFHQALSNYGYECVFASDIDKYCIEQYEANYKFLPSGDIRNIHAQDIPTHDILCAGFPCQPFSIAGKKIGFDDTRGDLFFEVERIIKHHLPRIVVLENVKNLLTHNSGETMNTIASRLKKLGYTVDYKVLCANDFGLPQKRERLFIVATRCQKQFIFPQPKEERRVIEDIIQSDMDTSQYVIPMEKLVNLNWIEKEFSSSPYDAPRLIGKIKKGGQGDRIYSSKAIGITISASSGGTGSKTGLYYINNKIRKLSPRECARIQGFPESYKFSVSDAQLMKQFGNSIPVSVLEAIFDELHAQKFLGDYNE